MAKYQLIGDDGENAGFVVVNLPKPEFEHSAPGSFISDGPISDAVLFVVVLAGFTGVPLFVGAPGWLAATVGISLTALLAALKAWRSPDLLSSLAVAQEELTIKVETWGDDGPILLDEIEDKTISVEDLRKVAKAVVVDNCNFSRPALCSGAGISQTTYHKIKGEFERLNFAHSAPGNKTILSPRAFAFLRKVYSLPR